MKKGTVVEGIVETVEFPNKGKLIIDGKKVEVKGGIAGQKVRVALNKVKKDSAKGRILEVLEPAPEEISPRCSHFGQCGGCAYQNLPYQEQLHLKERQLRKMMDQAVNREYVWEGISPSPKEDGYRNKMEFSFGDAYKDGPLTLGMHKKGSFHDIVCVEDCRIVDEDFRRILKETLSFAEETGLPYYHRMRHEGIWRHLLIRKGEKTKEILVDLVTASSPLLTEPLLKKWTDRLLELELSGTIVGILHTKNDSLADAVIDEGTDILYGRACFYEELLGLKFQITPFSFFQTNSLGAEVLYEKVREYIGETKDKVIFDLYSGTGTIAQMLAEVAKQVVGVEIVEEAVTAAGENARSNGLKNCTFWAGDVLKVIEDLPELPDLIVLDPPRDGVHPKALEKIISFGVEKIVYIACKPTSLARDLEMLQGRGYQVEKMAGVDLFPGTVHVETVCLLSNRKPDTKVRIDVDLEDYYRIKDSKKNQS